MPALTRDVYCTIDKFCQIYDLKRSTVNNLRKQGLPFKKIGAGSRATIRINLTQAEKWIEQFN